MQTFRLMIIGGALSLTPLAGASGQGSAPPQSAPQPLEWSGVDVTGSSIRMWVPTTAGGYTFADTLPLTDGSHGVEYVYKQAQNSIRVLGGAYPAPLPVTRHDTMTLVQSNVEPIRQAIEQAVQNQQMQAYHKLVDRADELTVGGHTIQYYWYLAEVQGIGVDGHYVYYAAFALPTGLVRVRGDLPWDAPPADMATTSMLPVNPLAQPNAADNAMDGGLTGGEGGMRTPPGAGGGGLGNEANFGPGNAVTMSPAASATRDKFSTFSKDLVGAMVTHPAAPAKSVAAAPLPAATPIPAACTAVPAGTDTVTYQVYASLHAPQAGPSIPSSYLDLVLAAIRQAYQAPNPLHPRVVAPMAAGGNAVVMPAVFGEVGFTLNPQGRTTDAGLTQSSLSHSIDLSLYNAVRLADSTLAFPAQIGVAQPAPVRIFVDLTSYQPKGAHSVPLFATRITGWHPGSRPAVNVYVKPTIPAGSQPLTPSDSALIQFAIDDRGVPIKSTMRLIAGTNLDAAEAVISSAMHSQYMPAMAGTCPVNGLLEISWRMAR